MSFEFITKLPSPGEIREQYPLPLELAEIKKKKDQEVSDIFTGKSDRFLLIIGPALPTTRILSAIMQTGWPKFRKK